jgi:hypothetical protein
MSATIALTFLAKECCLPGVCYATECLGNSQSYRDDLIRQTVVTLTADEVLFDASCEIT